jgi:hypothetical protein
MGLLVLRARSVSCETATEGLATGERVEVIA